MCAGGGGGAWKASCSGSDFTRSCRTDRAAGSPTGSGFGGSEPAFVVAAEALRGGRAVVASSDDRAPVGDAQGAPAVPAGLNATDRAAWKKLDAQAAVIRRTIATLSRGQVAYAGRMTALHDSGAPAPVCCGSSASEYVAVVTFIPRRPRQKAKTRRFPCAVRNRRQERVRKAACTML